MGPAPAPSIHPTVYTLSSTINTSWGWGSLPSEGPPRPILDPYRCLIEHTPLLIELTALSLGPLSPLDQGKDPGPAAYREMGG